MKRKTVYRRCLIVALFFTIIAIAYFYYDSMNSRIPDHLILIAEREETFDFKMPLNGKMEEKGISVFYSDSAKQTENIHFDLQQPFSVVAEEGSYELNLKLFGVIDFKKVRIDVVKNQKVIPCGNMIGLYVETDGIMVLGTGTITGEDGISYEPALNIIKSGDYILAVNDKNISSIQELSDAVQKSNGSKVEIKLKREEEVMTVGVQPVKSADGLLKIGTWMREDTQGIGTLTYVDEEGNFGALGHGITDSDTGYLVDVETGTINEAELYNIIKGERGNPGVLVGVINKNDDAVLGEITHNTAKGVFGKWGMESDDKNLEEAVPIALKQDIREGKAEVLCQIEESVERYEIEIERINMNSGNESKGMMLKVTDERLLDETNGIVQGMSGSPILQNGRIVGAVTHVLVNDPTRGYGIFIENMLEH